MYKIYWLINEHLDKTYLGFTDNLQKRLLEHKNKKVKTTASFGNFQHYVLEEVATLAEARVQEKYWKSSAGRKKLKVLFSKLIKKKD